MSPLVSEIKKVKLWHEVVEVTYAFINENKNQIHERLLHQRAKPFFGEFKDLCNPRLHIPFGCDFNFITYRDIIESKGIRKRSTIRKQRERGTAYEVVVAVPSSLKSKEIKSIPLKGNWKDHATLFSQYPLPEVWGIKGFIVVYSPHWTKDEITKQQYLTNIKGCVFIICSSERKLHLDKERKEFVRYLKESADFDLFLSLWEKKEIKDIGGIPIYDEHWEMNEKIVTLPKYFIFAHTGSNTIFYEELALFTGYKLYEAGALKQKIIKILRYSLFLFLEKYKSVLKKQWMSLTKNVDLPLDKIVSKIEKNFFKFLYSTTKDKKKGNLEDLPDYVPFDKNTAEFKHKFKFSFDMIQHGSLLEYMKVCVRNLAKDEIKKNKRDYRTIAMVRREISEDFEENNNYSDNEIL